ncbi:MAG: hypothetical protein JWO22_3957 [Frankiales bacterium]|nr:hypothetical protein [Frankiales bacterium]
MDGWTLLIAAHAAGACLALVLGGVMVVRRPRGDLVHRRVGRIWMVLMYWVVLSSFGITRLRPGHLSWIHGLSVWTFISLTMAWRRARAGRVLGHRAWAIGAYGGLVGAFLGAVAFPQRLVPRLVVHEPLVAVLAGFLVGAAGALAVRVSQPRSSAREVPGPGPRSPAAGLR